MFIEKVWNDLPTSDDEFDLSYLEHFTTEKFS